MSDRLPLGARRARRAALVALAVLLASVALAVFGSVSGLRALLLFALLVLPLLAPLPGIVRDRRRTFAWATLCLTPYLLYGITESVANPRARGAAAIVLLASLASFIALVAYLRLTRATPGGIQGR